MPSQAVTPGSLRASRDKFPVALAELLAHISAHRDKPVWVFEGEDIKYYGFRIEAYTESEVEKVVKAGGKSIVLRLLERVVSDAELKSLRIGFFVDRDFDETHPEDERLYVTPTYSIENLYVTPSAVKKVLAREFGLPVDDVVAGLRTYSQWLARFNAALCRLNAWIRLQRKLESENAEQRLNLQDVPLNKLVSLKFKGPKLKLDRKYTLSTLGVSFPGASTITSQDWESEVRRFRKLDMTKLGRGKYVFEFCRLALAQLKLDSCSNAPKIFAAKKRVTCAISGNILSELSQYADTPQSLIAFLRRYRGP